MNTTTTMKGIQIPSPGMLSTIDLPLPTVGPDDVLLKTVHVGLCGSDLNTYRGLNPLVQYPVIPGHELAASVVVIGEDVPIPFQEGQLVTVSPYANCGTCSACKAARPNACANNQTFGVQRNGCLQPYFCVPWAKVHYLPGLSAQQLVLVEPLSVGFHAVRRARVQAGQTVAVLGCGVIGLGAMLGAMAIGAEVVAVDVHEARLAQAMQVGARAIPFDEVAKALPEGREADVVIEAAGVAGTYRLALELVAFCGVVSCIGYAKAPIELETKRIVQKEIDIVGSRNALPEDFDRVMAFLRDNPGLESQLISARIPPDPAAIRTAFDSWPERIKTIITF